MDLICNVIISSLTGVFASFFVWWLTFKIWVPKIRFSDKISRTETEQNKSGLKYRFKFENYGRRNVVDLEVIVRLRMRGIKNKNSKNWEIIYLPTSTLDYKKVAILKPVSKSHLRVVLEIRPYECEYFQNDLFPNDIIEKSRQKTLSLEDVMRLSIESEFQIMLIGTDEFSGSRKFFESKVYKCDDIIFGSFEKESLKIKTNIDSK